MPSFTLLGSQVLRLPFIPYTSLPHEILHNWWGNGVWIDYDGGNWSEGLTAYLSDHLMKELRGEASDYRRKALQRYGDFAALDLPAASYACIFADQMLEEGIYVIGFSYPVVPKGQARIRTQLSAGHERHHLEAGLAAFRKIGEKYGILGLGKKEIKAKFGL